MRPLDISKTKAYTFLLPMIYGQKDIQIHTNNYRDIHNVYITLDDTLVLVNMANLPLYRLKIEAKYINEYNHYLAGKYSNFSPYYKLQILKFWCCDELLKSVLFRGTLIAKWWMDNYNEDVKSWNDLAEYWPKPYLKKEQFKINIHVN